MKPRIASLCAPESRLGLHRCFSTSSSPSPAASAAASPSRRSATSTGGTRRSIGAALLASRHSHSHNDTTRRSYASEATFVSKNALLRARPPTTASPPAPAAAAVSQPQHQHPESIGTSDSAIDDLLISIHERTDALLGHRATVPLSDLYEQLSEHAGRVLHDVLPYGDTPLAAAARTLLSAKEAGRSSPWLQSLQHARRLIEEPASAEPKDVMDDGLLLVAHIVASKDAPSTSWSLGFAVRTLGGRQYVVSCSHTLETAAHAARGLPHSRASSTLIITRRGHVYPAQGIPSALPLHDIVLYSLPATPINAQPGGHLPLTSVPVALYPPHIGTKQHLLLVGHDTWHETSVVGYKDPRGNDVEPGTYDELNSITFDLIPTPGTSGGPLVSSAGAVTALIRGSRLSHGDRTRRGFGVPAEKIFEMFQLPGLKLKNET